VQTDYLTPTTSYVRYVVIVVGNQY
jgi:hypothetical protein